MSVCDSLLCADLWTKDLGCRLIDDPAPHTSTNMHSHIGHFMCEDCINSVSDVNK